MMSRLVYTIAAVTVGLHGLVHLLGFVIYWPLTTLKDAPYKTTLLNGKWDLGSSGMRVFSVLWLVCTVAFCIVTYGMLEHTEWWRSLLLLSAAFSSIICILDWRIAKWGVFVNVVIFICLLADATFFAHLSR